MAQLDAAGIFDDNGNIIDSAITQVSTMSFKGITTANVQKALQKIYDTTHADYSSQAGEYGASIIKQIQGQVNGNIVSLTSQALKFAANTVYDKVKEMNDAKKIEQQTEYALVTDTSDNNNTVPPKSSNDNNPTTAKTKVVTKTTIMYLNLR